MYSNAETGNYSGSHIIAAHNIYVLFNESVVVLDMTRQQSLRDLLKRIL